MKTYIVLYRNKDVAFYEAPLGFRCEADDADHAEEQCLNAEPNADIVWVIETDDYQEALQYYYHWDEDNQRRENADN